MFTSAYSSTLSSTLSTPSTLQTEVTFAMSAPSADSMSTKVCSSKAASLKSPHRAYKQVLAKLRAGLTSLRLKTKKAKKTATGGQLAPAAEVAPTNRFGRPVRAIVLPDVYYGQEHTAKVSARFITQLFDCPPTLPGTSTEDGYPDLAQFIAYALFVCQLDPIVNDHAMCLLLQLKLEHPGVSPPHGYGLYLSALRLAARAAGNEDCTVEDWAMVGQWIFSTEQLEIEQFCTGELLGWDVEFEVEEIARITKCIERGDQLRPERVCVRSDHFDNVPV